MLRMQTFNRGKSNRLIVRKGPVSTEFKVNEFTLIIMQSF